MGWIALALLGIAAMAALVLLGVHRSLWSLVGAALMLGATGYALQGHPTLPDHPADIRAQGPADDPGLLELRDAMLGRFSQDWAYQKAADAMAGDGDRQAAVQVLLGGIQRLPRSMALWTGLGTALAAHDGGRVSPPALFAFRHAARLQPLHPGPPFFLGLAYIRANDFVSARPLWAKALALTPSAMSYRRDIAIRLALLDRYLAALQAERGAAGLPPAPR